MKSITPLPCYECRGQCCTNAPMSMREYKTIRKKYGIPKDAVVNKTMNVINVSYNHKYLIVVSNGDLKGTCAFLKDGKCSVYDVRPLTCRAYGVNPKLPCQYLYPEKAKAEVDNLARKASNMAFVP